MAETETTAAPDKGVDDARALAAHYAGAVRERFGERIHSIRLFGSAARRDWSDDSDVDVLVLLDRVTVADSRELSDMAFKLGLMDSGLLLQPVVLSAERFGMLKARERAFALSIEREGVEL